ncbi:hypothetical protein N510_003332 [Firmicutes bacterium ASF500]|nr:hypothetical protein N510_003332 [Firmicutes bacterium ASF500]
MEYFQGVVIILKLLYLTGSPATGKSTITNAIFQMEPSIQIIRYSDEIKNFYAESKRGQFTTSQLRMESSKIISHNDISNIDQYILKKIQTSTANYIILESHAITVESYGFRATPFSVQLLGMVAPNLIVCLYSEADLIFERIKNNPQGRLLQSTENIHVGQFLQMSLALQYGILTNAEIHFINTQHEPQVVAQQLVHMLIA